MSEAEDPHPVTGWRPCKVGDWIRIDALVLEVTAVVQDLTARRKASRDTIAYESDKPVTWSWLVHTVNVEDRSDLHDLHLTPEQAQHLHRNWNDQESNWGRIRHVDDHYPRCSTCGEAWPCWHARTGTSVERSMSALERRLAYEAAHPHVCPWCERFGSPGNPRRFKKKGGLTLHMRKSRCNPARWNLAEWVPYLAHDLRVWGGYDPRWRGANPFVARDTAESERNLAACRALMVLALAGLDAIPATIDDLNLEIP